MTEKPNVLIVSIAKHFGGAEVRVVEMAELLHGKCGYGVVTLEGSPLELKLRQRGLTTFALSVGKANPSILFSIYKIIRKGRFTIVDCHNPQSQFWGLLAAVIAGSPVKLCTVHSSYGYTETGVRKFLYEMILKLNMLFDVGFISVSEAVSEYLSGLGLKAGRAALIRNGISMPAAGQKEVSRQRQRQSLGLKTDDFVIISVGRLEPVKGHSYLLEAVSALLKEGRVVKLLIVGDGRDFNALNERIKELGLANDARLLGFRADVGDLLPMADCFCMPSLSEGLPYALLEACAFELPVVASNVGGMAHLLRNGKTAVLTEPENVAELVSGIKYIMDNPQAAKAMGSEAYAVVNNEFSIETMRSLMLGAYGLRG
ncbi:MAG: glycosyltransferase family 4 protein [Candidatus Magnetominusculus sp. LBB02]|nr:glycosyltransferase family 4 protein [Candidatus Magnetominusculus sp. LBB02]